MNSLVSFPAVQAPLVIDVAGTALSDADRARLAHPLVGGVILFTRNWRNRAQLVALCADIKALRPDMLICVDHEGGRVQRFRGDGLTSLPPMRALGARWMRDDRRRPGSGAMQATNAATALGYILGSELRACAVDLSFTPVLDLDWTNSEVIGDRAFHGDARVVTVLAKSLMHGLLQAGMGNCAKHFPGHGFAAADSHVAAPVDGRRLAAILADDAAPYGWLHTCLCGVMPAHVVYTKVDPYPAGFSARWLQDILRGKLGFDGAIFSDDLSMEGARRLGGEALGYTDAAVLALQAGCDMVLLCNQSQGDGRPIDELIAGLQKAADHGCWQPSAVSENRRLQLLPQLPPLPWDELQCQPRYMQALELLAQL